MARGTLGYTELHTTLRGYYDAVTAPTFPRPAGVYAYVAGDAYRGRAAQEEAFSRGASNAHWLESPHNYRPALAVDIYPITDHGDVSTDPADYVYLVAHAESVGLRSGRSWGDWSHVQLPDWHELAGVAAPPPPEIPGAGSSRFVVVLLVALAAAAAAGVFGVRR